MAKRKIRFVDDSAKMTENIIGYLQDKKGVNIVKLDFENVDNMMFDYFVICSGTSRTHTQALADWVAKEVRKEYSIHTHSTEGEAAGEWILMDYGDTIVHIFQEEQRHYYNLEGLWADAQRTDYAEEEAIGKKRSYKRKVSID